MVDCPDNLYPVVQRLVISGDAAPGADGGEGVVVAMCHRGPLEFVLGVVGRGEPLVVVETDGSIRVVESEVSVGSVAVFPSAMMLLEQVVGHDLYDLPCSPWLGDNGPLCANDDETKHPVKFRLWGS